MEEALIAKLLATSGVTALVSTRVYAGARPQALDLPAVVLNLISANPSYSDDGEDGIQEDRIQLDCWAETYSAAKSLSRAVIDALSAFGGTVSGVNFQYIELDLAHDTQEGGSNATDYPFRTSLDFIVVYLT